jgi:hypothetical protein
VILVATDPTRLNFVVLAPTLYGVAGDAIGLRPSMLLVAMVVLPILPLLPLLRPAIRLSQAA